MPIFPGEHFTVQKGLPHHPGQGDGTLKRLLLAFLTLWLLLQPALFYTGCTVTDIIDHDAVNQPGNGPEEENLIEPEEEIDPEPGIEPEDIEPEETEPGPAARTIAPPTQPVKPPDTTWQLNGAELRMFELVNQARQNSGVGELKLDYTLARLARLKSEDMVKHNYFSHDSPTYGSPFDMMKNNGIIYSKAAENLALYPDVESAHQGLMNSDGHRANILDPDFTHFGAGMCQGGQGQYFTQLFIAK